MAEHNPTECGVCNENFDEDDKCPRNLSCSHHLCSECIDKLIAKDARTCPFCRKKFDAKFAKDLPMNQVLLDCIRYLKVFQKQKTKPIVPSVTFHKKIIEMKEEVMKENDKVLLDFTKVFQQAEQLLTKLETTKVSLNQEITELKEEVLPKLIRTIVKLDEKEGSLDSALGSLKNHLEVLKEKKLLLLSNKRRYGEINSFEEAVAMVDEAGETNIIAKEFAGSLKDEVAEKKKLLPVGDKEIKAAKKLKKELLNSLESKARGEEIELAINIGAGVIAEPPKEMTALELYDMEASTKSLVKQGRVYAVQGNWLHSKLTLEDGDLHLYSLKEGEIPKANTYFVKYDDVKSLIGHPVLTFMDISVGGVDAGRVHIRHSKPIVSHNVRTGWSANLFKEWDSKGFLNQRLQVLDRGSGFERVLMPNNSRYDAGMISDISKDTAQKDIQNWVNDCGLVYAMGNPTRIPTEYDATRGMVIYTGPYRMSGIPIGKVMDGLDVLRNAFRATDGFEVYVIECGFILRTKDGISNSQLDRSS